MSADNSEKRPETSGWDSHEDGRANYPDRAAGDAWDTTPAPRAAEADAVDARYDALYDELVWDNALAGTDELARTEVDAASLGDDMASGDVRATTGGAHFEDEGLLGRMDPSRMLQRLAPGLSQPSAATYVVVACLAVLVLLMVLGSVLTVGDHLAAAHPALAVIFYLVVAVLVLVGIVWPVVSVARRPVFSLYQLRDEAGHAK